MGPSSGYCEILFHPSTQRHAVVVDRLEVHPLVCSGKIGVFTAIELRAVDPQVKIPQHHDKQPDAGDHCGNPATRGKIRHDTCHASPREISLSSIATPPRTVRYR